MKNGKIVNTGSMTNVSFTPRAGQDDDVDVAIVREATACMPGLTNSGVMSDVAIAGGTNVSATNTSVHYHR